MPNKTKLKLSLGTVQLGLDYGIANKEGKPNYDDAIQMLTLTNQLGIEHLDTAPSYGDSEEVIGQFIQGLKKDGQKIPRISSKLPAFPLSKCLDPEEVLQTVRNFISATLESLTVEKLTYCLLHDPQNMLSHNEEITHALVRLKEEGLIEKIGVSVYTPEDVRQFLKMNVFDVIQVPFNLFDQRLLKTGLLSELKKRNVEVHARSIFLQGLFFLDPKQLPVYLQEAYELLRTLRQLSESERISIHELCILFVREIEGINQMIIGCESKEQVLANFNVFKKPPLPKSLMEKLMTIFNSVPEKVINPTLWR